MKVRFLTLVLVLSIGLFSSCSVNKYTLSKEDAIWEFNNKLLVIRSTPDSLRSAEDKALYRKLEFIWHERQMLGNDGKTVLTISREEMKEMGLPDLLYDDMKWGLDSHNKHLDEKPLSPDQLQYLFELHRKAMEAYWERKRLNPEEYEW